MADGGKEGRLRLVGVLGIALGIDGDVASMPRFFWYLTLILPARWFMVIARGIFLRGSTAKELALPVAAMALFAVVMIAAATRRFKRDLEP